MGKFDYFRRFRKEFIPRTPAAALRGVGNEILPVEAFIYLGTSIKPLDEEPYDMDDIERMLGREDLDASTNLLLVGILNRLVKSKDSEIALLAAEGINDIENRYNKKIEELKKKSGEEEDVERKLELLQQLSQSYYDFSQLYPEKSSMRNFYLKEGFSFLRTHVRKKKVNREILNLLVRIFLDLGLSKQATLALLRYGQQGDTVSLLLEAEVEFRNRNFVRVFQICTWLLQRDDQLSENERQLVSYWLGH